MRQRGSGSAGGSETDINQKRRLSLIICVFDGEGTDFSTNGLRMLSPSFCEVEEEAGGWWGLTLRHPLTEDGAWRLIVPGAVLRAPVPQRQTPAITLTRSGEAAQSTVIWRVKAASQLTEDAHGISRLYAAPSFGAEVLRKLRPGTEYVWLGQGSELWHRAAAPDGTGGWMYTPNSEYVRTETTPGTEAVTSVCPARQVREQLFRVTETVCDTASGTLTAYARHLSYDLLDDLLKDCDFSAAPQPLPDALDRMKSALVTGTEAQLLTDITGSFSADVSWMNPIRALLDPDFGAAAALRARVIRDNRDIFLLKEETVDRGVTLRGGWNLKRLKCTRSVENTVNRILPCGCGRSGRVLLPEVYIDSETPGRRVTELLTVDGVTAASEEAYATLRAAAQKRLDEGCASETLTVTVDFAAEDGELDDRQVFLYDTVTVSHPQTAFEAKLQVTGYRWDALRRRYNALTLGDAWGRTRGEVAGYSLAEGSVSLNKLDGSLQALLAGV